MVERITVWIGSKMSLVVHTGFFIGSLLMGILRMAPWDLILLVLTTAVSLEAIYLAIFIQMTMNRHAESLKGVEEDVDEIQKDVDEIQKDIDEIQEDVDEIQEDDANDQTREQIQHQKLEAISDALHVLLRDVDNLKRGT